MFSVFHFLKCTGGVMTLFICFIIKLSTVEGIYFM